MADPRAENCRAFRVDGGLVTGVELDYVPMPQGRFELRSVALIDEAAAGGNTVATVSVYDKDNLPCEATVFLGYPWQGGLPTEHILRPGNSNRPVQHVIVNGYNAAGGEKGPLAIYVGLPDGTGDGDVIGGLGLPNNRHVSFAMVYKERSAVAPPPNPEPEPDPGDGTVIGELRALRAVVERLAGHLGA